MLACTCKIVGVEDALVVRSSCGASWSALEKDLVLVIRIVIGLALDCGAGLGSLCRFGCSGGGALSSGRFDFYLVDGQMVLILAIFTSNGIAELFEALSADAELLSDGLLGRIISEENEGLQSCIGVSLFIDAPQDVVEERLEIDGHSALGRLVAAGDVAAAVSGATG